MSKKSNKTSHVLNILTNRTGLSSEKLERSHFIDAEEFEQSILIVPEGAVEIQAETIEIKTDQLVEKLMTSFADRQPEEPMKQAEITTQPQNETVQSVPEIAPSVPEDMETAISNKIRMRLEALEMKMQKPEQSI